MNAVQSYTPPTLDHAAFGALLRRNRFDIETLDLSNFTLSECIVKMCLLKQTLHPAMARNYAISLHYIQMLHEQYGCVIYPIHITGEFWINFIAWLSVKCGVKYSTIKTVKCQIMSTLNWASKYGVRLHSSYNDVEVPKYNPFKLALRPFEVAHIYYLDFSKCMVWSRRYNKYVKMRSDKIRTLERVRDHFVLACNLGQRHSDMVRLRPEYFKDGVLSMIQQKTGNRCSVDIKRMSMDKDITFAILRKYNYHAPYPHDVSNYDSYLKEILQIAGNEFFDNLRLENKINGVIVAEEKSRWRLIASHTARRSFATYNVSRFISRYEIMKATGHTSESSFNKYICDEAQESGTEHQ